MTKSELYYQLEEAVYLHLKSFQTDLTVHDFSWIMSNPKTPFLHAANENGTHLIALVDADKYPATGEKVKYLFSYADREHLLNQVVQMAVTLVEPSGYNARICHYYDGETLSKINRIDFVEKARTYARNIRLKWRLG